MTEDRDRDGYRERLHNGQVVYFAEPDTGSGEYRPDSVLVTKKATITDAGTVRRYLSVLIWNNPMVDIQSSGLEISKSPRELFTAEEVLGILQVGESFPLDASITDSAANRAIAHRLLMATVRRMNEDTTRPVDPES